MRDQKNGGETSTSIFVREALASSQLSADVTPNDAFNVCAVTIGSGRNRTLLSVYRPDRQPLLTPKKCATT